MSEQITPKYKIFVTDQELTYNLLTIKQYAQQEGYSIRHVQTMCDTDRLTCLKVAGVWFIALIDNNTLKR